jgi:MFS transporter, DHA1 family, multidrug resistance protein
MSDILRDSAFGQLARLVSNAEAFKYAEELTEFVLPQAYNDHIPKSEKSSSRESKEGDQTPVVPQEAKPDEEYALHPYTSRIERCSTRQSAHERGSNEIVPVRTNDGLVLVTWYIEDDNSNPQNWSTSKKLLVSAQICFYTFSVYIGSSLYVASEPQVVEKFGVGDTPAALGLALYVFAYGLGPMLWSPLSEIPRIGRNPIYIATFGIFVALCVGASLVNNFAGLMVLRFLLGLFGSPCLATGGASFGDIYAPTKMPYVLAFWAGSATLGPALGPVVSGFAVSAESWRWSSWELLWLSGPIWLLLFFCLPETSHDAILLARARRLRRRTDREDLRSQSELTFASKSFREIAAEALIKPWQINILDPAVLFTTFYTALVYGIFYSFFESFPLVYPTIYGFNLGQTGLPFLAVLVALAICIPAYCAYFWYCAEPVMLRTPGFGPPEARLVPGLYASFLVPIGCFMFGESGAFCSLETADGSLTAWAARPSVHWIVSVIGVGVNMCGTFTIVQCMFLYLPFTYPQYSASLFAANDLARSSLAAGAILFSRPMFLTLSVAGGVSLLGGLTIICIAGIFVLCGYGAAMRARSRFAVS